MEAFKRIRLRVVIVLVGALLMWGCQEEGIFPNPGEGTLCTDCPGGPQGDPPCEDCD